MLGGWSRCISAWRRPFDEECAVALVFEIFLPIAVQIGALPCEGDALSGGLECIVWIFNLQPAANRTPQREIEVNVPRPFSFFETDDVCLCGTQFLPVEQIN